MIPVDRGKERIIKTMWSESMHSSKGRAKEKAGQIVPPKQARAKDDLST